VKTLLSLLTASALAVLAKAEGSPISLSVKPERDLLLAGPRDAII